MLLLDNNGATHIARILVRKPPLQNYTQIYMWLGELYVQDAWTNGKGIVFQYTARTWYRMFYTSVRIFREDNFMSTLGMREYLSLAEQEATNAALARLCIDNDL